MVRPEVQAPPDVFYSESEAHKYSSNSHIQEVQRKLTERALELLLFNESTPPSLILDIGCGSGISGECLTELGHAWIGIDISKPMLAVAQERECDGDLLLSDMGCQLRFRQGSFDAALSISAIQWLCNQDASHHIPYKRLLCFFTWLYAALNRGARAVFQFYPKSPEQLEMITSAALRSGFGGGVIVDFPNSTKAKKHFLVIWAGFSPASCDQLPKGLDEEARKPANSIQTFSRAIPRRKLRSKMRAVKDRDWVLGKKEQQRKCGRNVRPDTKYTARKRPQAF